MAKAIIDSATFAIGRIASFGVPSGDLKGKYSLSNMWIEAGKL
jgi:hypothetical protein